MKKFRRCFIAINHPDIVVKEILRIQSLIKEKDIFSGKFTERENLHLTLKFLGEIDEIKIEEVKEKLKEVKFNAFKCSIEKLGIFSKKEVRIILIKIEGGVYDLQKEIDKNLISIFNEENRFMGHITIARVSKINDRKRFFEALNKIKLKNMNFEVKEFSLIESELRKDGPIYKEIEKYRLKSQSRFK